MCIICISKNGVRQPSESEMFEMWQNNPHGAGYMVSRGEYVEIHKGFMNYKDFIRSVRDEKFGVNDSVVYHFRISTQAGVNPFMCHPFPFTTEVKMTKALDLRCAFGIAHNGIIPMTSNRNLEYSDTALFIANYLPLIIRNADDLKNYKRLEMVKELINSRMCFLEKDGTVTTIGNGWITENNGLIFSNGSYKPYLDRFSIWK